MSSCSSPSTDSTAPSSEPSAAYTVDRAGVLCHARGVSSSNTPSAYLDTRPHLGDRMLDACTARTMNALLTDLYELNMVASYLRRDMNGQATFSLFVRRLPQTRGFLVAAGIQSCLDYLESVRFDEQE